MRSRSGIRLHVRSLHYRATRNVIPLRRSLGIRTIFNFLGPLLNPARVKRQLTGVNEARYVPVLAEALAKLGSSQAMLVHGREDRRDVHLGGDVGGGDQKRNSRPPSWSRRRCMGCHATPYMRSSGVVRCVTQRSRGAC